MQVKLEVFVYKLTVRAYSVLIYAKCVNIYMSKILNSTAKWPEPFSTPKRKKGSEVSPAVAALINDVRGTAFKPDQIGFLSNATNNGIPCMNFITPFGIEPVPTELVEQAARYLH
jgi:hypothetical protein